MWGIFFKLLQALPGLGGLRQSRASGSNPQQVPSTGTAGYSNLILCLINTEFLVWGQSHLGLLWELESFYPCQAPLCCLCPALQLQQQRLARGSHAHLGAGRAPQPGQGAQCCLTNSPCKHPSNTADAEQSRPGAQALCRYLVPISAGARALSCWCIHILLSEFLSGSFRVLSVAVLFSFGWVGISF